MKLCSPPRLSRLPNLHPFVAVNVSKEWPLTIAAVCTAKGRCSQKTGVRQAVGHCLKPPGRARGGGTRWWCRSSKRFNRAVILFQQVAGASILPMSSLQMLEQSAYFWNTMRQTRFMQHCPHELWFTRKSSTVEDPGLTVQKICTF